MAAAIFTTINDGNAVRDDGFVCMLGKGELL